MTDEYFEYEKISKLFVYFSDDRKNDGSNFVIRRNRNL